MKYPTGGKQQRKPASTQVQIRLNSGADSIVWMKEEQDNPPPGGEGNPEGFSGLDMRTLKIYLQGFSVVSTGIRKRLGKLLQRITFICIRI